MSNDSLGERMKGYEAVSKFSFTKRSPLIVRVDGRHFHTFTRHAVKPFDQDLIDAMVEAAQYVASDMQGFKVAFAQSDEVSFLISDYDTLETQGWFNYELNKIVSIAAARMTARFNQVYGIVDTLAEFDARAFTVPRDEVANYFVWRAKDWHRNSVQMLAQAHFSHKELFQKKLPDMHEMLHTKDINWADLSLQHKNGTWINRQLEISSDTLPNFESIDNFINKSYESTN